MNPFDLKCYEKTYMDSRYWGESSTQDDDKRRQSWADCRNLTDRFYDELVARGYLTPHHSK